MVGIKGALIGLSAGSVVVVGGIVTVPIIMLPSSVQCPTQTNETPGSDPLGTPPPDNNRTQPPGDDSTPNLDVAGVPGIGGVVAAPSLAGRPQQAPPEGSDINWPVDENLRVTSGFGPRWGTQHNGTDFAGGKDGLPIYAVADGKVVAAGPASGFGQWIKLEHTIDGKKVVTVYGHMWDAQKYVKTGQTVKGGQRIADIGSNGQSTGPHLHLEVWVGASATKTDPLKWLQQNGDASVVPVNLENGETTTAEDEENCMQVCGPGSLEVSESESESNVPPSAGTTFATLDQKQREHAATIINIGLKRGIPVKGLEIAIATAMQESTLYNLDYGDRDSLGLFQQRPSQGWGSESQLTNPKYAANAFYGGPDHPPDNPGLLDVSGWFDMPLTVAAQKVQRSGFPDAYAKWENLAKETVLKLGGSSVGESAKEFLEGPEGVGEGAGELANSVAGEDGATICEAVYVPGGASDASGAIVEAARTQLGVPYSWGGGGIDGPSGGTGSGKGVIGFDCSSLVEYAVYHATDGKIDLPRTTTTQVSEETLKKFPGVYPVTNDKDKWLPGDLLYEIKDSGTNHVSIYMGNNRIIHAPQTGDVVKEQELTPERIKSITDVRRIDPSGKIA